MKGIRSGIYMLWDQNSFPNIQINRKSRLCETKKVFKIIKSCNVCSLSRSAQWGTSLSNVAASGDDLSNRAISKIYGLRRRRRSEWLFQTVCRCYAGERWGTMYGSRRVMGTPWLYMHSWNAWLALHSTLGVQEARKETSCRIVNLSSITPSTNLF